MSEDKLLPHVENLVPGLVTVFILAMFFNIEVPDATINPELHKLLVDPIIAGILFIAISYQVGVIVFTFSRLFVDLISEFTFRWILLKIFDWETFSGKNYREINEEYCKVVVKESQNNHEVRKRRERGRLVRTALIPSVLLTSQCSMPILAVITSIVVVVFLFAYAEVSIYKEAKLAA
jgi:hypothetical protein